MPMQESGEMYLETIFILSQKSEMVRAKDVAEYMKFSKPSVSRAMGLLKASGHIVVHPDGNIRLTEAGDGIARKIFERHTFIERYLTCLGVSPDVATQDSCKIEHVISDETFEALKRYVGTFAESGKSIAKPES